jgi:hypothetical protein
VEPVAQVARAVLAELVVLVSQVARAVLAALVELVELVARVAQAGLVVPVALVVSVVPVAPAGLPLRGCQLVQQAQLAMAELALA